jgi:hypothetical protein
MKHSYLWMLILLAFISCKQQRYEKTADGVIINLKQKKLACKLCIPIKEKSSYFYRNCLILRWALRDSNPRPSACKPQT